MRQSKVIRLFLASTVSLLLFSTTTAVAAGSSSITKFSKIPVPQVVTLTSIPVSTTAFQSKRSGKELCVSRHCKQKQWLLHHPRPRYIPSQKILSLVSTAYTGGGLTYTEEPTHDGVVAIVKGLPLGRYYQIRSGPLAGKVVHGADYIGGGSEFDIWLPTKGQADTYGRQSIQVAEIPASKAKAALAHHT